ncbi:hypothetical protein [Burkholderia sp. Ac-20349]|uniref:hypothetical protein n=1 Tax=Burkholderia sp. Ac-20349 TaxID=2703893 RepID=UPI00197B8919|nr:hypothetical protein [Burkholderia sp. Ac-20349]MBN3839305.1 hypothetical protein [Burkholderia sp. Ac-20349]
MSYPTYPDGITVEEAVERLAAIAERSHRTQRLCVAYDPGHATMGGTPSKLVRAIYPGFDWDASKVFIDLGERLKAPDDEQARYRQHMSRVQHTIGFIGIALRSSLTPEGKLKAIQGHYDACVKPAKAPTKA